VTVERVRVGALLALQRRAVEVTPDGTYEEIGIRSFGRGVFHKEPLPGTSLGAKRVFRIEPGDLLLSNVFAWEGAIAVAGEAERGKIGSHRFMTYTPVDAERIDTEWASWFFRSEPGLELIRQASPGSAGRNRTLAIDRFEALEIPLPPIDEQRRIADSIDRLQTATSALAQLSTRTEHLAEALGVSIVFRADLAESERTRVGWRTWVLDDLLALDVQEVDVDPGKSYEIAGVYSFGRGMFLRAAIDGTQTSYKKLHRVATGQVVMSRLKAWEGALARVPKSLDGCYVSPEFPTFRVRSDEADPEFLGRVVTSKLFWSRLRSSSQGIGARRERVSADKLLSQEVSLPPIEHQRSAGRILAVVDAARANQLRRVPAVSALVPAALNAAFDAGS
jgi:type I restriction enzyme S subunit